jgi:signal transduction histidine kinase
MLSLAKVPRFLTRLGAPADSEEQRRIERVLASARVVLACAGLIAIFIDPTEPSRYANAAYALLAGYVLYSFVIWAVLNRTEAIPTSFPWIHILDLLFPAIITLFTDGPNSAFFLYFVFVLTAAAYRWGFIETFATAIAIVTVMTIEAASLSFGYPLGTWLEGDYEVNRFIIRAVYLILIGVLLGYLAEKEKELRAEGAFITRMGVLARVESGLRGTMHAILGETMRLFLAPRALAVVDQLATGRVFVWDSHSLRGGDNSIATSEVAPEERAQYVFPMPAHSWYAQRRGSGWTTWAIDGDARRARLQPAWSPEQYPLLAGAGAVAAIEVSMGSEWNGTLFLLDARLGADKLQELRFAQKLFRQIAPALYSVYLLRRLRSRAGAVERARVARELHDGALQALIAIEMDVDLLRREAAKTAPTATLQPRLERIQDLLREQVFDVRTLMQQMRTVSPAQLLDRLADAVERFRRDTGIAAEFVTDLDDVDLSPRVCRELVRITQEALANVRKHSGAQSVFVHLGLDNGSWILAVEDNGRGFEFSGRKSLPELDAARAGPAVIKERVRILGGNLEIESLPGQGTRLEVTFPQKAQTTYV